MRNLLVIGMCVLAAFMAGWFQVNREGETTTIQIDRAEIRQDARQAIDRGREFLDARDQERQQAEAAEQTWLQGAEQPWLQGEVSVPSQWLGNDNQTGREPAARVEWTWPQQP